MNPTATDLAIASRRSIRAFLPTPIARDTIETILDVAARAPSGTNMQPWRGHVLVGAPKDALCDAVCAAFDAGGEGHVREKKYYPDEFFEPYLSRRRKVGFGMYGLLGIGKGDAAAMKAQHRRNFRFFDAPVGMIFTIHRKLETGSWLDYGMFLQNIITAARARGIDSCAQAAWSQYHTVIREVIDLPHDDVVVCGMALGYADPDAPVNRLDTDRAPAREFMTFRGFTD
ncbi:MAG: nitroreductase [Acetobacteraceae bacterium]